MNPRIGGLLIRGDKGTGKSTAVRSLAALLPGIPVVADCPYHCEPGSAAQACDHCRERMNSHSGLPTRHRTTRVVELPVNASVDRVVGSVDFERTLRTGTAAVAPGVLAAANRGWLYADEVNLLDDHLTTVLLDVMASGVNHIEREGISFRHPARFAFVGTMNPEEGELRPQLLDRFGLCVQVNRVDDPGTRVEILRRRERFDTEPAACAADWAADDARLRDRIVRARLVLPTVRVPERLAHAITHVCLANGVAGHRADLIIHATARTLAALGDRTEVTAPDLQVAAALALPHRTRNGDAHQAALSALEALLDETDAIALAAYGPESHNATADGGPEGGSLDPADGGATSPEAGQPLPLEGADAPSGPPRPHHTEDASVGTGGADAARDGGMLPGGAAEGVRFGVGHLFRVPPLPALRTRKPRARPGRRAPARSPIRRGRYVRSVAARDTGDVALDATIRAAAPHQQRRSSPMAIAIEPPDMREKVREQRAGYLLVFIVDASGSMGTSLMVETKAAMLSLLLDAYQRRDSVALVTFGGSRAEVLLPPTSSVETAQRYLTNLPAGGKTPLAHGLVVGYELVEAHLRRYPDVEPWIVLISDGEANVGLHGDTRYDGAGYRRLLEELFAAADVIRRDNRVHGLVLDTESQQFALFRDSRSREPMARRIARALGASYSRLEAFREGGILQMVRTHVGP